MNSQSTVREPVTVIGLGNLGRAVAATFLRNGHPTTIWNRSAAKANSLAAHGATVAAEVGDAVAASELVVIALLDPPAVTEVLNEVPAAVHGHTLVNLTSGGPEDARALARWSTEHDAQYVHGAVYAIPQTIGTAESSVNYSGSAAYERWQKPLALLGKGTFLGTDAGLASGYDVAVLAGMYGLLGGFLHAAAMARTAGIGATELTPKLVSWLTDVFPALSTFAEEIDAGNYATEQSSLAMNQAGLATIIRAGEDQGVPSDLLAPLADLIGKQVSDGHGAASLARVVEALGSNR
ncbi:NAD(P)-dependent oxidoreductase [Nocardia nova]|uniref:NAD(P)-dependent oxidoreductase n=1 Tax=Nocardia nova TaxID=37330 RepID=UPI0033DCA24A